jgi:predicted O-linked N-acetylglucosamine transferase (SPINDLY family)
MDESMARQSVDQAMRRAAAHLRQGDVADARRQYLAVLKAWPGNARARQALDALDNLGPPATPVQDPAIAELDALFALLAQGDFQALALAAEAVLRRFAQSPVVWKLMGIAFARTMRTTKAAEFFTIATGLAPGFAEAHNNLGNALQELGRLDEAVAAFQRAVELAPDNVTAKGYILILRQAMCDWREHDRLADRCRALAGQPAALAPFAALTMVDDPALQQQIATGHAAQRFANAPTRSPAVVATDSTGSRRLRIGYFSADFHDHATLYVMAGVFRAHDRERFEVFGYSYGQTKTGRWRDRAMADIEHFHDVAHLSDPAIASLARSHDLDVAIDLKGYTQHSRSEIFGQRLARLHVSMLGFPGTMGTGCIDYMIADPVVIPDEERAFYSERVLYLPDTYYPTDDQREIAGEVSSRRDWGLPEQGFVFCCFNANHKISPREFDIWMRCLSAVEGSVLWLLDSNRLSKDNLRSEAQARGIDADRIVFAAKVPIEQHLARHRHADLFIDTFHYNAHTTASDALWAGLPIVTRIGRQMCARVSASLLAGMDLPELITRSDAEYEAMILQLAGDPSRLAALRQKVASKRGGTATFDTRRYTRHLEAGLSRAHALCRSGELPRDIRVEPIA